jgi:hypothetical protein
MLLHTDNTSLAILARWRTIGTYTSDFLQFDRTLSKQLDSQPPNSVHTMSTSKGSCQGDGMPLDVPRTLDDFRQHRVRPCNPKEDTVLTEY